MPTSAHPLCRTGPIIRLANGRGPTPTPKSKRAGWRARHRHQGRGFVYPPPWMNHVGLHRPLSIWSYLSIHHIPHTPPPLQGPASSLCGLGSGVRLGAVGSAGWFPHGLLLLPIRNALTPNKEHGTQSCLYTLYIGTYTPCRPEMHGIKKRKKYWLWTAGCGLRRQFDPRFF
jgi:hypothetical protein